MSNPLTSLRHRMRTLPLALHDLTIGHTSSPLYSSFTAKDGALVDLIGLEAVAAAPHRVLEAALAEISATDNNIVLDGMEVSGNGLIWPVEIRQEDATRRLEILARGVIRLGRELTVSPGSAIVRDRTGRHHVVTLEVPTPPENRPNPRAEVALVLEAEIVGHQTSMREQVRPRLRFVPLSEARQPHVLVLAQSVGSQAYATDVHRLLRPDHPIIENLLTLIEYLEHVVWDSDRHGWAWQRRQQGREWSRYQTTATLALQATRSALMVHPSTTMDRIRLLRNLHFQLRRSIENAEESLTKWLGKTGGPDPYRAVLPVDVQIRWNGRRPTGLVQDFKDIFSDYMLRDQQRDMVSVFLYAPLNPMGRQTLINQVGRLSAAQDRQHRVNEDHPSSEDIAFIVSGAKPIRLNRPDLIVDQLAEATGWLPR